MTIVPRTIQTGITRANHSENRDGKDESLIPMNTTLRCPKCENGAISVPENSPDESVVTCPSCGAELGPWGELIAAALDTARENFEKTSNQNLWNALYGADSINSK